MVDNLSDSNTDVASYKCLAQCVNLHHLQSIAFLSIPCTGLTPWDSLPGTRSLGLTPWDSLTGAHSLGLTPWRLTPWRLVSTHAAWTSLSSKVEERLDLCQSINTSAVNIHRLVSTFRQHVLLNKSYDPCSILSKRLKHTCTLYIQVKPTSQTLYLNNSYLVYA